MSTGRARCTLEAAQQGNHTADPLQRSPCGPCQLAPPVDNGGQAVTSLLIFVTTPAVQIIFPEYSCQGFHPTKWRDFTTTLDGPEVAIFKEACKRNKVRRGSCRQGLARAARACAGHLGLCHSAGCCHPAGLLWQQGLLMGGMLARPEMLRSDRFPSFEDKQPLCCMACKARNPSLLQ